MKHVLVLLVAVCVLTAQPTYADEQRIAIVAGAGSDIQHISATNVRRVYLGATIIQSGVEVKPLLNQTDTLAMEVFMQKVLFMSVEAYQRQLLVRTFRGGFTPKPYTNLDNLLSVLQNNKAAITFMLYSTAINTPGVRIIDTP